MKKQEARPARRESYGGKNLKKDFKKTSQQILPEPDNEDGVKEKEIREKVAMELLETERSYVEKLNTLVEVFEVPFREANILSNDQFVHIFSNLDVIRNFNTILLKDLEQIISNWTSNSLLGGVFLQMADFLKLYTTYINNYTSALQTISFCKQSSVFTALLEKCESSPRCEALNLPSLLIMPVQRIPRYILLLTELLKHTPNIHPDYERLTKSLDKVKVVAIDINEAHREAESLMRLYELNTLINHLDFPLITPSRRLELEGELKERVKGQSNGTAKSRYYFLFNDVLMSTKRKGKHHKLYWYAPLSSIVMMSEVNSEFGLAVGERVVFVSSTTLEDTRRWAQIISLAQHNLSKTIQAFHDFPEKRALKKSDSAKLYSEEKCSPPLGQGSPFQVK